jgi:hypothetical protein
MRHYSTSVLPGFIALMLALPVFAGGSYANHQGQVLTGKIWARDTSHPQLLFKFRRTADKSDGETHVVRTYTYPDGRVAAVEKATYRSGKLATYSVQEKQTGAHGRLKIKGDAIAGQGKVTFHYVSAGGDKDSDSETLDAPTVINETIIGYIHDHFKALMAGKSLDIRYMVIPRVETVGFTLSKSGEDNWNGRQVVNIKMDASSFFIRLAVDPVYFTFDAKTGALIQYTGRATPKIRKDGDWKALDAVTSFKWVPAKAGKPATTHPPASP